jgi:hypothetical protein
MRGFGNGFVGERISENELSKDLDRLDLYVKNLCSFLNKVLQWIHNGPNVSHSHDKQW